MSVDTFTVAEEDIGNFISVTYYFGEKVSEDTFQATIGEREVWATIYDDIEAGVRVGETLLKVKNPHLCNFISVNLTGRAILFIESGYERLYLWIKLKCPIWEYNNDNTEVLSMGFAFINVFNGIIDGLRALHNSGCYHGNFLEGVTVSQYYEDDIDKCIAEDLDDLIRLVKLVVTSHPPANNLQMPESVQLFLNLDSTLKNIVLDQSINESIVRFRAYFTHHNPIFAGRDKRLKLTKKFVNFWKISTDMENNVLLRDPPVSIETWWLKIHSSNIFLSSRLHYSASSFFNAGGKPGKKSIVGFYRDCFSHKHEDPKKRDTEDVAIEMALHKTFPDFLPKCYYEFVQKLAGMKFNYSRLSFIEYFKMVEPRLG